MTVQRHIMIVDGNAARRSDLAREAARFGYGVIQAATAEAAARTLTRARGADLLLVEAALPDSGGRDLIAQLRRRGLLLPAILLADAASEDDLVRGLDAGADDYLVRPLRLRELAARIRSQFRISIGREETDLHVGVLTFRPTTRTAFHPFLTHPVRLTEKEAALLGRLCRAEGRPVSRQTLLREVWGYSPDVSSHTVETHVYRLRRKIEGAVGTPPILLNDEGGYRLATFESVLDEMGVDDVAVDEADMPAQAWNRKVAVSPLLVLAGVAS
jgi:DNA-binding response OmpR family regulator